jgi:hypothetical protein
MGFQRIAAACVFGALGQTLVCGSEKWTDSTGTKTLEAEFIQLDGIQLKLKKSDGAEVVIPLYKLDDASRLQARKLAKAKAAPIAPTGEGAKPAFLATPLNLSDSPVEFPKDSTIQQFLSIVTQEYEAKNFMVAWDGLPIQYQKDLDSFKQVAIGTIDPATMKEISKTRANLIDALRTKKNWILSSKELQLDEETLETVSGLYDPIVDLLETLLPNDAWDVSAITNTKSRDLVKLAIENLSPKVERLMKELPDAEQFQFSMADYTKSMKAKGRSATEAEVTASAFGQPPQTSIWVRVDGRWIDRTTLESAKDLPRATEELAKQDKKQLNLNIRQGLAAAAILIGTLAEAESQSDVDDMIRDFKSQVMTGIAAISAMQGRGFGGSSGGPPQFGASGFGGPGAPDYGAGPSTPRPPRPSSMPGVGGSGNQSVPPRPSGLSSGGAGSDGVNSGGATSGGP